MRIAYMLTSLGIGGAEKQAIEIAERMAVRGHDVLFFILRSPDQHEWPTSLPIVRLAMSQSLLSAPRALAQAAWHLRVFKPDLLHSHTFPANMLARVLHAVGAAPPIITTIHNVYEGGRHRDLAYRVTDRFSSQTTAVSQEIAHRCIQAKLVPQSKCTVITNGIDTEGFSPSAQSGLSSIKRGSTENLVWLSAGRDVPAKDFDNLLAAFQIVRAEMPNSELRIAGKAAKHREDANCVRWLGLTENVRRVIAASDVFVLSSAWEGMPLVVGEAMAMEKPVVATDVGGVRELLGNTGLLVPSKNPQALADAMLRVMRMPEADRAAMGKAARARIIQHFEINAKADEWEALYLRVISR